MSLRLANRLHGQTSFPTIPKNNSKPNSRWFVKRSHAMRTVSQVLSLLKLGPQPAVCFSCMLNHGNARACSPCRLLFQMSERRKLQPTWRKATVPSCLALHWHISELTPQTLPSLVPPHSSDLTQHSSDPTLQTCNLAPLTSHLAPQSPRSPKQSLQHV